MSPFSRYFHQLRTQSGLRQIELAALVGYEQSYLSALELGTKGPPTQEFIARLSVALNLTIEQSQELQNVAEASNRNLQLPFESSEEVYWLFQDLRCRLSALRPAEIKVLRDILQLTDSVRCHASVIGIKDLKECLKM